jgi:formylglycine-generating enzyme required for sulfatase activity
MVGREDMPVNYVSFYESLRFANWLHNGQPTGAQDGTTTEDGGYDMSLGTNVIRKVGAATVFLTSEDEWYKAAYYDAGSKSYFEYPAGSDAPTTCEAPGATANTANCAGAVGDLTEVGSYTNSASASGTFDQGGNVWEVNEEDIVGDGSQRGLRGGSGHDNNPPSDLAAARRWAVFASYRGERFIGFRVATVPEPDAWLLGVTALLAVAGLRAIGRNRRNV